MKLKNKNKSNIYKAIIATSAIALLVVGFHFAMPNKDDNVYSYELSNDERFNDSSDTAFSECKGEEPGANCIAVSFNKDSELHYSVSIWTKQQYLGGAFDEINAIREGTFEMKEYTIGRSLRRVNGLLAPFDHTAYWSFSSHHKECVNSDGTYGRCNFGMDKLILEEDTDFVITYTYL